MPNLLQTHPPFQIDGSFGYAAAVGEMLIQSHDQDADGVRMIDLLPALPQAWPSGSLRGLRARGGFEVNLEWANGVLGQAVVKSVSGTEAKVRYQKKTVALKLRPGGVRTLTATDFK
jgi:alpha-L-fucosidase 2